MGQSLQCLFDLGVKSIVVSPYHFDDSLNFCCSFIRIKIVSSLNSDGYSAQSQKHYLDI